MNNPSFDWKNCLEIANQNPKIAKEILKQFADELPSILALINKLYEDKNYKKLLATVHQLHGACSYCGVIKLKGIVAEIEKNLNSSNYESLSVLIVQLNQEIEKILTIFNENFFNDVTTKF